MRKKLYAPTTKYLTLFTFIFLSWGYIFGIAYSADPPKSGATCSGGNCGTSGSCGVWSYPHAIAGTPKDESIQTIQSGKIDFDVPQNATLNQLQTMATKIAAQELQAHEGILAKGASWSPTGVNSLAAVILESLITKQSIDKAITADKAAGIPTNSDRELIRNQAYLRDLDQVLLKTSASLNKGSVVVELSKEWAVPVTGINYAAVLYAHPPGSSALIAGDIPVAREAAAMVQTLRDPNLTCSQRNYAQARLSELAKDPNIKGYQNINLSTTEAKSIFKASISIAKDGVFDPNDYHLPSYTIDKDGKIHINPDNDNYIINTNTIATITGATPLVEGMTKLTGADGVEYRYMGFNNWVAMSGKNNGMQIAVDSSNPTPAAKAILDAADRYVRTGLTTPSGPSTTTTSNPQFVLPPTHIENGGYIYDAATKTLTTPNGTKVNVLDINPAGSITIKYDDGVINVWTIRPDTALADIFTYRSESSFVPAPVNPVISPGNSSGTGNAATEQQSAPSQSAATTGSNIGGIITGVALGSPGIGQFIGGGIGEAIDWIGGLFSNNSNIPSQPSGTEDTGNPGGSPSTGGNGGLPVNLNPFDPNSAWSANSDSNPGNNVNWNPFDGNSVWWGGGNSNSSIENSNYSVTDWSGWGGDSGSGGGGGDTGGSGYWEP